MKLHFWTLIVFSCLLGFNQLQAQKSHAIPKVSVSMDQKCFHFYFTGKVQGVYFRATSQEYAREIGIKGWVRNLDDGRVEMQAQGRPPQLKKLLDRLEERFEIQHVNRRMIDCREDWVDFEVKR